MFVRAATQAARSPAVRATATPMARIAAQQTRLASSEHAIANPTLAGIEKRWEGMPPQEQADLFMQLRDRMKVDWHEMTLQEKKAAYWIAFGSHGPRKEAPKGEGWKILSKVTQLVAVSVAVFYSTRFFAKEPPRTLTKEWQEASNEYAKKQMIEPISGISNPNYEGQGYVQSPPAKSS